MSSFVFVTPQQESLGPLNQETDLAWKEFDFTFAFHPTNTYLSGLDYTDNLDDYEDLTDDDDDEEYDRQTNRYCGFAQNFLDKGVSKQLPALPRYKTKYVTPEVRALYMQSDYDTHALMS